MRRELQKDENGNYYYQLDDALWPLVMNFRGERAYSCSVETEIDMTDAEDFRQDKMKKTGVHISINSLIIKAAADILKDFPILCGTRADRLDRIVCTDPNEIRIGIPIQIGDTIRDLTVEKANQKDLLEISKELDERVRYIKEAGAQPMFDEKKPFEERKPVFVISNVGTIGPVTSGFGQLGGDITSMLGILSILKKPVVKNDEIVIRKMMNVILLWDHFAMFASTPVEFLTELKKRLEEQNTYLG